MRPHSLVSNIALCSIIEDKISKVHQEESTTILGQFAINDPVFRASGGSIMNPQQDKCKGSAKEDVDLTIPESNSNNYFHSSSESSSESDSDNVSPKLNPPPIQNRTTQVNPRWTVADIIQEFSGNSTMPQYNPNNKINRCAIIDPNIKKIKEVKIGIKTTGIRIKWWRNTRST